MHRLIVTCDDLGMHRTVNGAVVDLLNAGIIRSASILATGVHYEHAAALLKAAGVRTVGVHLCLGSEYPRLPMAPVCPVDQVRSLVDTGGAFHPEIEDIRDRLDPAEVERELGAQINRVLQSGFLLSHLDGHMFFYEKDVGGKRLEDIVLKLGDEYDLHVRLRDPAPTTAPRTIFIWENYPTAEHRDQFYDEFLRNYDGDETELIIHPAKDLQQLESFTFSGPLRVADYRYFSALTPERLARAGITIVGWGDLRPPISSNGGSRGSGRES